MNKKIKCKLFFYIYEYMVFHAKLDKRKQRYSASKNAKIVLKKRFKEHLSSNFLC